METKERLIDVLEKIIKNKKYDNESYPKIILKCPATAYGEHKMVDAFLNIDFILSKYFEDLYYGTSDDDCGYDVLYAQTCGNGCDMPSDFLNLDEIDVFYVDVYNALDIYDEHFISCSGYYTNIKDTDKLLKMNYKNSLIIDVDEFNSICDDCISSLINADDDIFKNEISLDSFKQLVNGTINEIDADVRLNIITLFSDVADVYFNKYIMDTYFTKSVKMVSDMLLYYSNENYTVDINTSEYNDIFKNVNVNGFVVATFNAAIKPKHIKVEYQYFSTKEKMCESLHITNRDKHSYYCYYDDFINNLYDEFKKEGNNNMKIKNIKNNGAEKDKVATAPANTTMLPEIDKIYYNKNKKTVIVFWANGTETKAITAEGDKFSLTVGIKECFIKYACGNNFDSVQNKLLDAKKKAVLTVSKEKPKKSNVERLAAEAANLTSDEKDELVKVLTEEKNTEVKPAKKVSTKRGNK